MSRRVRIKGRLRMTSALHVGGGVGTTSMTDAGVVRHADGRPYIPGSSLKGALRSHLERICQVETLTEAGATSCLLYLPEDKGPSWNPTAPDCPTPGWIDAGKDATKASEKDFGSLCATCTLFGSPILAGKIRVPDLEVDENTYNGQVEIRDGVGIDRDRGRAVDQVKFDYEVIPSDTVFEFELSVDSPDRVELGLVAIAIRELQDGNVSVGGKTTRGLGHCELIGITVEDTDFGSISAMADYFKRRTDDQEEKASASAGDPDEQLDQWVDGLFGS